MTRSGSNSKSSRSKWRTPDLLLPGWTRFTKQVLVARERERATQYNDPMEKVVRVFDSAAEADKADALADAQLSPDERLRIVIELRERRHPNAAQQGLARVSRVVELEQSRISRGCGFAVARCTTPFQAHE